MLLIILLVIFVVVLLLWFLLLVGVVPNAPPQGSPWLAFIAVLVLGIVVFLTGSGVIVMKGP